MSIKTYQLNHQILLNKYRSIYGIDALLLYKIKKYYYIFSNDLHEMKTLSDIIDSVWSKRKKDIYNVCWIPEEHIEMKIYMIKEKNISTIIYNDDHIENVVIPDEMIDYVVIGENNYEL